MSAPRIEDALHEAIVELTVLGERYLDHLAEQLSPGMRRGVMQPLLRLQRSGPLRVKELADALGLDPTTITRHVDDLAQRGLVVRVPDPADRRAVLVQLTSSARSLLDAAEVDRRGRLRSGLCGWSAGDRTTFADLLTRFVNRDDLAADVARLTA